MMHLSYLPSRYPPTLRQLCKHSHFQGPLEMPHSSVALPRFPYMPTPTLSPTPGTLQSRLAAPGFLSYSSSLDCQHPQDRTRSCFYRSQGHLPKAGEITHLLRERTGGMQLYTPRYDKPQAGVSHVPRSASNGGQGKSYRSKQA